MTVSIRSRRIGKTDNQRAVCILATDAVQIGQCHVPAQRPSNSQHRMSRHGKTLDFRRDLSCVLSLKRTAALFSVKLSKCITDLTWQVSAEQSPW